MFKTSEKRSHEEKLSGHIRYEKYNGKSSIESLNDNMASF